ncbi:CopG family transcriptional regulator [Mycobacterium sp. pUA109]|uniref:CopG family transcriptional regulator n=1 Tax=Mycobacterium sp. pUA109 TaxID=3238982 RepID=UPI00351B8E65
MSMKRTNVYADEADLALIKEAAARRGVPEAEILREGIRLAALGARVWDEPLVRDDETVDLGGPLTSDDVHTALGRAAQSKGERTEAYR